MTPDNNPQKPEWFELADSDAASAQVTKVNKMLPITALFVAGAAIATGAFFANASGSNANVEAVTQLSTAATTTGQSISGQSTTGQSISGQSQSVAASSGSVAVNHSTTAPAAPSSSAISDPTKGGVPQPGANREDEDDEHGEGRERGEHHEREGHEDRERHEEKN